MSIVRILKLEPHNASLLRQVADDVFDNAVNPDLAKEFVSDPRHHMMLALHDDLVIGMASAVHYIHPDKPPELWINEVGVAPEWQRQGIGRQLLHALLEHGRVLGCEEAWLGTENDNAAANALYRSAGGKAAPFVVYTFSTLPADDAT